jgi:outer membrane biosynthesis protein TonB
MTAHPDILDQPEPLRKAFLVALGLHLALIAAGLISTVAGHHDRFGDKNAGGAAVGIEAVDSIPLPHEGPKNPLANDTESQVQQAPAKPLERVKKEVVPPDATPLKVRKSKKPPAPDASEQQKFRSYKEVDPYKVYNKSAPQVSATMFSAAPGSGNIGAGPRDTLGDEFAGYGAQIRDIVAWNWHTGDIDARVQVAPKVIATFDLMRDGSVQNVKLLQTSGISSLDNSVQRAILDSKLIPLPAGFRRDHASIEFWFELKR